MEFVNVAATWIGTRALGPGLRSVVWVQGCPFRCLGCMSPQWIPQRPARWVAAGELAAELLADPAVTGLTFSGGEPMMQAAGLAAVARAARRVRDVSVLSFTGFALAELRRSPPSPAVGELLAELDVLIDGRYEAARNDGRGLRGSSNQQIHQLTARHAGVAGELADGPRSAEVGLVDRAALLVGVPPPGVVAAFDLAVDRVRRATRATTATAPPSSTATAQRNAATKPDDHSTTATAQRDAATKPDDHSTTATAQRDAATKRNDRSTTATARRGAAMEGGDR